MEVTTWDDERIRKIAATVDDPYVRSLFQRVFLTPDGIHALVILLFRWGFYANELVTERDVHRRNCASDLLQMTGYTRSDGIVREMLEKAKGRLIAAHAADLRENQLLRDYAPDSEPEQEPRGT